MEVCLCLQRGAGVADPLLHIYTEGNEKGYLDFYQADPLVMLWRRGTIEP